MANVYTFAGGVIHKKVSTTYFILILFYFSLSLTMLKTLKIKNSYFYLDWEYARNDPGKCYGRLETCYF